MDDKRSAKRRVRQIIVELPSFYHLNRSTVDNTSKKNVRTCVRACVYLSARTPQAANQFPVTTDRG